MKRLAFVLLALACLSYPLRASDDDHGRRRRPHHTLHLVEATIDQLLDALEKGLITSEQLVEMYKARIDEYEDLINAFIYINPDAEQEARALDRARRRGHGTPNSPLFGIPVLLKDNINTNDMPTTAGSVALEGSIPPRDAFITRKLRRAGAIILGKATLTEFANFIAIGMPTGYSSLGPSVSTHMIRESIRVRRRIRIRQPPTAGRFLAPGGRAPDPASAWPRTS